MTDDRPTQPENPGPGPSGAPSAEPPPLTAFAWRNGLVRPTHGRLLSGVCGALARATNTDPILWRVIIAVLTIFGGFGVLLYLLGWLMLPADGDTASPVEALLGRGQSATSSTLTIIGGVIALISVGAFVSEPFRPGILGAILLGAAALLLLRDQRGRSRSAPTPPPTQSPTTAESAEAGATTVGQSTAGEFGSQPYQRQSPFAGQNPFAPQAPFAPRGPFAPGGLPPQPPQPRQFTPPPPRPPAAPRSRLGRLTFSLLLVVVGTLIGIDLGLTRIPTTAYLAAALGTVALGLIIGAWFGRARGLIALGIVLSIALASVAGADQLDHGWRGGTVTWAPTSVSQLQSSYRQNVGDIRVDLSKVDFASESGTVEVETRVDVGSVTVVLPPNVDVVVDANLDVGNANVLGQKWNGLGLAPRTVTDNGADGAGGGKLHIIARVDLGNLEVSR